MQRSFLLAYQRGVWLVGEGEQERVSEETLRAQPACA